jgi:hypothetical protein
MRKMLLLVAAAGMLSLAAAQGVAADGGKTQCNGFFSGTTKDLVVPAGGFCVVEGGTITHDVTVGQGAFFGIDNSSVGHDVTGNGAAQIEFIGYNGPISVGHDVTLTGTSPEAQSYGNYEVCDTTIGHDLTIAGVNVAFDVEVGDTGTQDSEFCGYPTAMPDSVGHDLNVSNNTAGRIDVGNNSVGHDLTVNKNTASTGDIGVDDNTVNHDATCVGNNPGLSVDGPEDQANHAGHKDTGCEAAHV